MTQTYKIRAVGGGLVVTIPRSILRLVPLKEGDQVTIAVAGAGVKDGPYIVLATGLNRKPNAKTGARAK